MCGIASIAATAGCFERHFIMPGKPMQNRFCGSFDGAMRDERLDDTLIFGSTPRERIAL
ncbi:integrase core domain-containing protein [Methylosinus sp. PW1]|uniref:integrase core domain-containing protein n=1 Tax=Methylosinus sp. PW1 TaxID=107636 RepID=UPI003523684F